MATPVIMPKQGQSVETCIITKWFRKKGDPVRKGDILFSYETDKAAFDLESPDDGILLEMYSPDGAEVPVLSTVAVIGKEGENTETYGQSALPPVDSTDVAEKTMNDQFSASAASGTLLPDGPEHVKIRISPRAKRLAGEKGLKYNEITGSGPLGRILYRDIEKALTGVPDKNGSEAHKNRYRDQPLSNIRKLIAGAMHASLMSSAQLTHHMSADARKILEARRVVKEGLSNGTQKQDITLNDMICWCVIRALEKFPEVNSHFLDDKMRLFKSVDLAVAVDTPRGLMVPVVKDAGMMDLTMLSRQLKEIAGSAKKGNMNPELLKSTSATFTVSNLGNYGVEIFTPVINLPQTAILGVCSIINRPADLGNNTFGFIPYVGLSLTYDHRAIDGGPATLFLREIKLEIEKFSY